MRAIALALLLAACTEDHANQTEFTPNSCLNCHTAGSGSNVLVHPESLFPLMSGGTLHDNINCQDCHKFDISPGILPYNADCTSACHLQNQTSNACLAYPQSSNMPSLCDAIEPFHVGLVNPNPPGQAYAWDSVHHDFCVQCHPSGLL